MNIGIVGYGKMGSAIFKLLSGGLDCVTVLDISEEEAKKHEKIFFKRLERSFKRKTITKEAFLKKKGLIKFTHRIEDLASADFIIEAIFENYEEKAAIFRKLESVISPKAVIATNTSSISIEKLAKDLKHKDRFCGLHFFHPVLFIELVEIIRLADTPDELIDFLKDFCLGIGRHAIVVLDAPGSVINAILAYYYVEALYIIEEGLALPSKVDELAKRFFYVGPCESMDVIGIDFFIGALERAATPGSLSPVRWADSSSKEISVEDTGGREGFFVPDLFGRLIEEKRFGKKVSKGIYIYQKDKPVDDLPEFYINPDRYRLYDKKPYDKKIDVEEFISMRLFYSVLNGSLYSLKKKMSSAEEINLGVKEILQLKQGPFEMMRAVGRDKLKENFDFLARSAGKRFMQSDFDFS